MENIELSAQQEHVQILPENEEAMITGLPFQVILYNDNWHTFDEVINHLVKATRCSYNKARDFAFEVHVTGKALVFSGSLQECLRVTSVLEEIELNTQIVS
ncbi:MAG: ATP-dependent Clp protease adaptor ClpS [Ignavibacteria bacterium]